MKIKLLTSISGTRKNGSPFDHAYGDEIEMDNETAKRLLESQQAEPVVANRRQRAEKRPGKAAETRG